MRTSKSSVAWRSTTEWYIRALKHFILGVILVLFLFLPALWDKCLCFKEYLEKFRGGMLYGEVTIWVSFQTVYKGKKNPRIAVILRKKKKMLASKWGNINIDSKPHPNFMMSLGLGFLLSQWSSWIILSLSLLLVFTSSVLWFCLVWPLETPKCPISWAHTPVDHFTAPSPHPTGLVGWSMKQQNPAVSSWWKCDSNVEPRETYLR